MKLPRYVEIDLTRKTSKSFAINEQDFRDYLGGKGLAAKILYDNMSAGTDAFSPDNLIVINVGPLTGTGAPSSSRFNISTKSPLTGAIASSNCGGTFGMKLRSAGYDGLVIRGQAASPVYIEIMDGSINVKDAGHLWGMDTEETQKQFNKRYGQLVIGPGGENLVRYACAVSGERVAGRCGIGAVMGSKNLKAVIAYGTEAVKIENQSRFDAFVSRWITSLKNHPSTGESMPKYGTAGFLNKVYKNHVLPADNYQHTNFARADRISGETLAEEYMTRNSGCVSCPIRCERRVKHEDKDIKGPEFETIGLLGSNIGNDNMNFIIEWNYQADLMGIDTISLGSTLAFAMELTQKGIKDFGLQFGSPEGISEAIRQISLREGPCAELADGVRYLSQKYGGQDFAIHAKGLEFAAYDPRHSVGLGLGYATSNRGGCHLNGGFLTFVEILSPVAVNNLDPKGKAALTAFFQNAMESVSNGGSCLFTTFSVIPAFLFKGDGNGLVNRLTGRLLTASGALLGFIMHHPGLLPFKMFYMFPHIEAIELATGIKCTLGSFLEAGERSFTMERMFNIREGFSRADDSLPARIMNEMVEAQDKPMAGKLTAMLNEYYRIRNWEASGRPAKKLLGRLGIEIRDAENV